MNDLCFQLKGSAVSVIVLELYQYTPELFARQLDEKTTQAPQLFQNSSIVISLENLSENDTPDFAQLLDQCRSFNLQPMAFRAVPEALTQVVRSTGLPLLPAANRVDREPRPRNIAPAEAQSDTSRDAVKTDVAPAVEEEIETAVEKQQERRPSMVITRPVRSGQQVYAEGADLVILSQVSEGAEVIADGDIHVYGALRGRALAGVKGNTQARIFCQNLSAELVSIAGNFILSDTLRKHQWQQPAHIYLDDTDVHVVAL
ncbi:MAG: septum site-determining protein MinC [Amphritea sp.]